MQTNWNQLIERYLNNELSAEGKIAFENELAKNDELRAEFELHKLTTELIQRNSLRTIVQASGKWYHLKNILVKSGIALIIAGVLAASIYAALTWNQNSANHPGESEQIEQSLLQKLEKDLAFENIDPEYFQFTGKSDVFLSASGVLLSLTEESFLLDGKPYIGEAIVQWQEARTAADIVKAGLSTKSGDQLLETQGMFSLNAFTPNGKKLQLTNKGVYVQVPVDEVKNGMKLFTGVPQPNGGIDWQNPVELERLPKLKDMTNMNLYPPRYEPKLNELKWFTEKKKRDSLYLSFEEKSPLYERDVINVTADSTNPQTPVTSNFSVQSLGNNEAIVTAKVRVQKGWVIYATKIPKGMYSVATSLELNKSPNYVLVGPVSEPTPIRWEEKDVNEVSFGHQGAVEFKQRIRLINTKRFNLTGTFLYQATKLKDFAIIPLAEEFSVQVNGISKTDSLLDEPHIPPSKVLAIWNKKFNNTNLATQDFEDRMKEIHETCDEKVFDLYAKNLNEPLWKLDERVVKMGYPQFQRFADQRVGKLKLDDVHQKNLAAFYEKAIEQLRETGKKNVEAALKKERQWDNEVERERKEETLRKGLRESANLNEEYGFNLNNVYKQLGVTAGFQIHGGGTIVNIDKYVWDATVSRQSTVITDPQTGKTAQITYEPMKMEVKNAAEYDRLFLYLFSKEIKSYQRLDFENGKLEYNLNGDMNYDAVVVGINEKGYFYHQLDELKPIDWGIISLKEISEKEFDHRVNAINSSRIDKPMSLKDELNWLFKEQANYVVQKKRRENQQFRNAIRPSIFSCGIEVLDVIDVSVK